MKRLLIVSHCILNTASKVAMDEKELQEEYRLRRTLMTKVMENDIQLLQLPCPEFILYGSRRWGHVKDQFDHPHFRKECRKMLEPVLMQLEEYLRYPDEYQVLGIVSVDGSPSCGYGLTCRGNWGGELSGNMDEVSVKVGTCKGVKEPGVLMEILEKELKERELQVPIYNMKDTIQLLDFVSGKETSKKNC